MEAIVFTQTAWPLLSNDKYSMVEEVWELAIEVYDHQEAVAGAPVGPRPVSISQWSISQNRSTNT